MQFRGEMHRYKNLTFIDINDIFSSEKLNFNLSPEDIFQTLCWTGQQQVSDLPVQVSFPAQPPAQVNDESRLKNWPRRVALNWFSQTGWGTMSSSIFFIITWYSPLLPAITNWFSRQIHDQFDRAFFWMIYLHNY